MLFIEIHGDAPFERGTGNAQILHALFKEIIHHLVLSGNGADKFGVRFDVFDQPVGVLPHSEKVCFFLFAFHLSAAIGAFAVYQLAFCEKGFAGRAIPAFVTAFIYIALFVKFTEDFGDDSLVIFIRSADEFIVRGIHAIPDSADFGGNFIHVFLRGDARRRRLFLDFLPVLVGACLQEHFIALFTFEARDRIRENGFVSVADMRFARSVRDRRRYIKFLFFAHCNPPRRKFFCRSYFRRRFVLFVVFF